MTYMRCDTLADPEKSVTGKPMNCWSLETRVSGLWSGVCIWAGYYSLPAYAGVTIRGIEDNRIERALFNNQIGYRGYAAELSLWERNSAVFLWSQYSAMDALQIKIIDWREDK